MLEILDDLVIYRKLLHQDPGEGWYTEQFVLHYADGRTEVISGSSTGLRKDHIIRRIAKDVYALGDMCIDHSNNSLAFFSSASLRKQIDSWYIEKI